MAIDIPLPMPPIPAEARSIEVAQKQSGGMQSASFADYQVEVNGPKYLSSAEINAAISEATNPTQAVLALNNAYYRAGHLLVRIHYALVGKKLSLFVVQGTLKDVVSPPALEKFFEPLIGDTNLTQREFDRRRLMADIKANRAGENVAISYQAMPSQPEQITVVFSAEEDAEADQTDLSFQLGNPGSRFLGRYFQQSSIRHATDYGTEFVLGWESALTSLGDDPRGGESYNNVQLALDHPTVFGLYGFDISYTTYEQDEDPVTSTPVDIDSEISVVGLNGRQVLLSSASNRLNLYQRIEHVETEIMDEDANVIAIDEPHTTVELGVTWYHRFNSGVTMTMDFAAEKGLSSDAGTLNINPTSGVVSAYNRTSDFLALKPKIGMAIPVMGSGNLSFDVIAQSSDEQLPQEQQWVLGGMGSLSAYLPGLLVGDTGYYARAAWSIGKYKMGGFNWSPSIFAEHGAAEYEGVDSDLAANILADGSNLGERQSVGDAGVRLEAVYNNSLEFELVAASGFSDKNISEERLEESEADFYFRIKKTF